MTDSINEVELDLIDQDGQPDMERILRVQAHDFDELYNKPGIITNKCLLSKDTMKKSFNAAGVYRLKRDI